MNYIHLVLPYITDVTRRIVKSDEFKTALNTVEEKSKQFVTANAAQLLRKSVTKDLGSYCNPNF